MASSRIYRRRLLAAGVAASTAVAGLALAAPAADAASGHAASSDSPLRHAQFSKPALLSKEDAAQKLAASVPHTGSYGFLLKLDTMSTGARFDRVRSTQSAAAAKKAARSQLDTVEAAQDRVVDQLGELSGKTRVLYRTHAVMTAVAVRTDVQNIAALYQLPGVAAVYPITPKEPDNSYAVPFQGAPTAWEGDANGTYLGQGIVVADIDTGLDYTHADFGGPGTSEAYETAHAADTTKPAEGSYDADKFDVDDSYDLVGDDYNADDTDPDTYQPVPKPDPNPLDCSPAYGGEGHGSHTAGTIAGYGVGADGKTYTGAYDDSAPFDTMKIGPGMAPKAQIMSLRVFGCVGSTDVVSEAIERAMDPNQDGDTSDHADVINMSLGSDFGAPDDADAVVADAAADLGVTVAISMGNSYDVYDVGGSPGASTKAITVAASLDAQSVVDGLKVSFDGEAQDPMAAERSVAYDWSSKPDLSGTVAVPSDDPTGCSPFDSTDAAAIAGKVALLTWTDDNLECGSVARSANVREAGGVGFIFASNLESFSAGITGDTDIPGVLVAKSGGDAIRAAIADGQTVTVDGTSASSVKQTFTSDNDKMTDFSSRGLRGNGNLKPDVAAVGGTVFSVLPGTGSEGQNMSGTSMAAPMVAGLAALVKSKHADWTAEQVKADIMNTADKNLYVDGADDPSSPRYAPMRVGAGRIDAASAISNDVLASTSGSDGAVSASFGTVELPGTASVVKTKKITLTNTGTSAKSYTAAVDQITTVPGVGYTVSPRTVTVAADETATVTLTMTADPTKWSKTFDPTKGDTDAASGLPQQTIAESSGNVVFTPASGSSLRVPFYAAPKPVSKMTQASSVVLGSGATGKLRLTGTGVNLGRGSSQVQSLAQGFDLTATSGKARTCTKAELDSDKDPVGCLTNESDKGSDIEYVGITSTAGQPAESQGDFGEPAELFAIATYGSHSTPADKDTFEIDLDVDGDGTVDYNVINTHFDSSDVVVSATFDAKTGDNVDVQPLNGYFGEVDTSAYDSDVLVIPVGLDEIAAAAGDAFTGSLHYAITAYGVQGTVVDKVGYGADGTTPKLVAETDDPGLSVTDKYGWSMALDQPGNVLTVNQDAGSYAAEGGKGLLMLHFHDAVGKKAQVLSVRSASALALDGPAKVGAGKRFAVKAVVSSAKGTPTGKVVLVNAANGRRFGTKPLRGGKATFRVKAPKQGKLRLRALYLGDAQHASAKSKVKTVKVNATRRRARH